MASNEKRPPRRARRMALAGLLLAAIVVGWLMRECGFGLGPGGGLGFGPGSGLGSGSGEGTASDERPVAQPDARPGPCVLSLSSAGLTLGGAPATLDDAVRACQAAGTAELHVTTAARAGTYDELKHALDQAGVVVNEHRTPAGQ